MSEITEAQQPTVPVKDSPAPAEAAPQTRQPSGPMGLAEAPGLRDQAGQLENIRALLEFAKAQTGQKDQQPQPEKPAAQAETSPSADGETRPDDFADLKAEFEDNLEKMERDATGKIKHINEVKEDQLLTPEDAKEKLDRLSVPADTEPQKPLGVRIFRAVWNILWHMFPWIKKKY